MIENVTRFMMLDRIGDLDGVHGCSFGICSQNGGDIRK
jgi:hypothetical protein